MLLFSISVHEQPFVIADQVQNFLRFNPDAAIVLHVSAWMPEADVAETRNLLASFPNVFLNTTRLWSGYGDGTQMKMHVVNFRFAVAQNIPFDYFCLHASNDMFVKSGLNSFVRNFDAGFYLPPDLDESDWVHLKRARADRKLKKMMGIYGLKKILGAQIEGSFYKRDIMQTICDRIWKDGYKEVGNLYAQGTNRNISQFLNKKWIRALQKHLAKGLFYAKEEFYFPTLSQDLVNKRAPYNYCYINWQAGLNISVEDIDNIRSTNYKALCFYEHHRIPYDELAFYTVKRVDRRMDDPLRVLIGKLNS